MKLSEMQAEIARLTVEVERLQTEAKTTAEKVSALETENGTLKSSLAKETEAAKASADAIQALKAENDTLRKEAKTASDKAVELLAAVGHKAPVDNEKPDAKSADEIKKEFAAITDNRKRGEFYEKHKDVLLS